MKNESVISLSDYKNPTLRTRETILQISPEHITQALGYYLHAIGMWPVEWQNEVLVDADFGLELNEDGLVEVDLTLESVEQMN